MSIKPRPYPSMILEVLKSAKRGGSFCASGRFPSIPGLEVGGVGPVSFPIKESDALAIIAQCAAHQAGQRNKRIRKEREERRWELDTSGFSLKNTQWEMAVRALLKVQLRTALGLPDGVQLESQLSKLLVYKEGDAFELDTPKDEDKLGVLAVFFPSPYGAGNLLVHHSAESKGFSSQIHPHEPWYAAFYGSCKTDIQPPPQGYGLCVLYDLVPRCFKGKATPTVVAPENATHVTRLAEALRLWALDPKGPKRLALPLDRKYAKEELMRKALVAKDQAKVDVLRSALREAGGSRPSSSSRASSGGGLCLAALEVKESGDVAQTTYEGSYEYYGDPDVEVSAELAVTLEGTISAQDIRHLQTSELLPHDYIKGIDWDSEQAEEDRFMVKLYSTAAIIFGRPELTGPAAT